MKTSGFFEAFGYTENLCACVCFFREEAKMKRSRHAGSIDEVDEEWVNKWIGKRAASRSSWELTTHVGGSELCTCGWYVFSSGSSEETNWWAIGPRDRKEVAKDEPRKDVGKRPAGSSTTESEKKRSVDPVHKPLEPWVGVDVVLSSYHEAIKWNLKPEVVEGLFSEEIGYSEMTMSL